MNRPASRLEELARAEGDLKVIVGSVAARRRALTIRRRALSEDLLRIARENPAQTRQAKAEIGEISIRLDELEQLGNVLRVLGLDTRPPVQAKRGAA